MTDERWVWVPFEVEKKYEGYRIDRFLARRLTGYSRSKVQSILSEARALKEGRAAKANSLAILASKRAPPPWPRPIRRLRKM